MGMTEIEDKLNKKLDDLCTTNNVPGMALMISKDGRPIYEKFYGYRDVEKKLSVDADTIFGLASITKSFAALAIMQLEDKGKLSVDDLVTKWLPELKLPVSSYEKELKIHHFLTHTSGLPGMGAVNLARASSIQNDPDGDVLRPALHNPSNTPPIHTVLELIEEMNRTNYTLLGAPGEAFNYSNEGYALLQLIIERASEQGFISYVEENILQPLHMDRTLVLAENLQNIENVTELYATNEKGGVFHSPAWWDVGDIYSNGSLKSSINDIVTYSEMFKHKGTVNGVTILSEDRIEKMMTAHVTLPTGDTYGYGVQVDDKNGITLVGHGGGIKGVSSHFKVVQEEGITAVILINLAEVPAEDILYAALEEILPLTPETNNQLNEVQLNTDEQSEYIGLYESNEGQQLNIEQQNNVLSIKAGLHHIPIHPYEKDGFYMGNGKKVKFVRDENGQIIGIFRGKRFIPKS